MRDPCLRETVRVKWRTPFWSQRDRQQQLDGLTFLVEAGARCTVENIRLGGVGTVAEVLLRLAPTSGGQQGWAWVGRNACMLEGEPWPPEK